MWSVRLVGCFCKSWMKNHSKTRILLHSLKTNCRQNGLSANVNNIHLSARQKILQSFSPRLFQTLHFFREKILQRTTRHFKPRHKPFNLAAFPVLGVTCFRLRTALCQSKPNRLEGQLQLVSEKDPPFDWKRFFQFLRPEVWYLLIAVVCALLVAVLNIQIPLMLGEIINVISNLRNEDVSEFIHHLKQPAVKLLCLYGAQGVLTTIYIWMLSCSGERVAARMRKELFANLIRQDIEFFDANKIGELINRLTTDVQDFKSSFKLCISQGLKAVTQTAGCVISLVLISPRLTIVMMVVLPTVILIGSLMGGQLRQMSKEASCQIAKSTSVADEALGNVRTVRAFAMENKEIELYNNEVEKACYLNEKLGFGIGVFQGLSNCFLNSTVLGILYVGGSLMATNQIQPGDLMSFLVASQTIQRSLAQLSILFGQAVRGLSAGSRVFEYLALQSRLPISGGRTIPINSLSGNVEFKGVHFSYPSRPERQVLEDFNLKIPGGKVVALCGLSGGGKSTVAALLERFYEVDRGVISVDGVDIKTLDPSWLRGRAIGFINQEPVLFATTVRENIRYGRPEASDKEVEEAARLANAHDFICGFPEGYSTILGERGVTISGGQKQRIAIARALLKNPAILILDEATSALDAESERVVQEALDRVIKNRTTLVIAHRLSTIQNTDIIAVVADGEIAEMGSHQGLLRLRGLYYELIKQQQVDHEVEEWIHTHSHHHHHGDDS